MWGLILGLLAVVIGAFGAHGLKPLLTADQQQSFETGIRYQMYHALLLVILSQIEKISSRAVLNLMVIGVLLFSGSIYLLNVRGILEMEGLSALGPVTPIGGLLLISGWIILIINSLKTAKTPS